MIDTIHKNKTFEQYLEQVKRDIYAEAGEVVQCQRGHYIMTCAETTYVGNDIIEGDFKDYSPEMYLASRLPGRCGICNNYYITFMSKGSIEYGNVRFWIDGEFRERKYK